MTDVPKLIASMDATYKYVGTISNATTSETLLLAAAKRYVNNITKMKVTIGDAQELHDAIERGPWAHVPREDVSDASGRSFVFKFEYGKLILESEGGKPTMKIQNNVTWTTSPLPLLPPRGPPGC